MKKIGLIGGMTWESTKVYYDLLNQGAKEKQSFIHSANCIIDSFDFFEIEKFQREDNWAALDIMMADSAKRLEDAGAEIIILCTNTMHLCKDAILEKITVPFLHIAQATGKSIKEQGLKKILLLGTKYTMEKDFYRDILEREFDIEVVIPDEEDRQKVHDVIFKELTNGVLKDDSRKSYQHIIYKAMTEGAQGVILGCTEIPLLIKQEDVEIAVFDTTTIHARAALELAL